MKSPTRTLFAVFALPVALLVLTLSAPASASPHLELETQIAALSAAVAEVGNRGDLPLLDTDRDGVPDVLDNCIFTFNTDQRDSNYDGYGNMCDADLDGSLYVDLVDLEVFRKAFFSAEADADFNGDGVVNSIDLGIFRVLFGQPPGPSAVQP